MLFLLGNAHRSASTNKYPFDPTLGVRRSRDGYFPGHSDPFVHGRSGAEGVAALKVTDRMRGGARP